LLSGIRTLHRTAFDYSAKGFTLRASAEALFNAVPGNKPYAVYRAIFPVYRESRSSGTTGTDIGHGDKHIDAISPPSDTAHWFNFRYDAVDLVLK